MKQRLIHGEAIRKLRQVKGFTQYTVAKNMNITQQAYSKIEKRKVSSIKMFQRILLAIESNLNEFERETAKGAPLLHQFCLCVNTPAPHKMSNKVQMQFI